MPSAIFTLQRGAKRRTCRVDTSPSEGQRAAGLAAQVCWGTAGPPQPSTPGGAHRDAASQTPERIRQGRVPPSLRDQPRSLARKPPAPGTFGRNRYLTDRKELKKATLQQSPRTIRLPQYATNRLPLSAAAGAVCGTAVVTKRRYGSQHG